MRTGGQKGGRGATDARARVGEWLKPTVCKIVALTGYAGSNPAPGTTEKTSYDWDVFIGDNRPS